MKKSFVLRIHIVMFLIVTAFSISLLSVNSYRNIKFANEERLLMLSAVTSSVNEALALSLRYQKITDTYKILSSLCKNETFSRCLVVQNGVNIVDIRTNFFKESDRVPIDIRYGGKKIGELVLVVRKYTVKNIIYNNVGVLMLLLSVTIVISFFLFKIMMNAPLYEINFFSKMIKELKSRDDEKQLLNFTPKFDEVKLLASSLKRYISRLHLIQNDLIEIEKNKQMFYLSRQIAHDIRSPLEALRSVTGHINDLDFQHRKIITSSIQRISDIANGLLREGKATEKLSLVNLNILLDELYQDKIFEHGSKIKFDNKLSYKESFINGDENILYRIFSNLINNAFESYDSSIGDVVILLESKASDVIIKVQDFGKGMSQELIEKVLEGGITTKEKGNGLGVSSAFEEIKKCHGTFEIDSEVGTGTTVIIKLSKLKAPSWFADSIEINNNVKKIICVDDDPGFLEVYQEKLKGFGDRLNCIHPKNLTTKNFSKESQYFFDYDLGKNEKTGLDIILENEIKANSTLVTSMYQDENIQKVCLDNGIKILPKQIFNNVKVNIVKDECLKIVFIDDDEIMHLSWNMEASKKNIAIKTYFKVEDFLKEAEQHSLETKIFIDSDLGDGVKGEVESKKIFDLGFTEIFLATGYSPQDIEKPDWIKKVVGKRPAF